MTRFYGVITKCQCKGVNVAARLEGLIEGGEIFISQGVHDHLRPRGGMILEDLGKQLIKNIVHPCR